jgi:hypothetical protein
VRPKLFIATPTADGIMLAGTVASLAALLTRLHADGVATQYATLDGQDFIVQRNVLRERAGAPSISRRDGQTI